MFRNDRIETEMVSLKEESSGLSSKHRRCSPYGTMFCLPSQPAMRFTFTNNSAGKAGMWAELFNVLEAELNSMCQDSWRAPMMERGRNKVAIRNSRGENTDDYQSAIACHLANDVCCASYFDIGIFFFRARTKQHLKVLEALYIQSIKPVLCRQKQFVNDLTLFRVKRSVPIRLPAH